MVMSYLHKVASAKWSIDDLLALEDPVDLLLRQRKGWLQIFYSLSLLIEGMKENHL